MVRCLLSGAALVIAADEDLIAAIERGKATHRLLSQYAAAKIIE